MAKANARDERIAEKLSAWFEREARPLPWRTKKRTGYGALVSEVMLQQTQVARVVESYRAFMKKFPTSSALARASQEDVLRMWKGLGYYRRARHLWEAAKMIEQEFGRKFPQRVEEMRTLPGIGRYTAGAVASMVFGKPEAIVDGNVKRVLARMEGKRFSDAKHAERWTWGRAEELVNVAEKPGVFNEAVMELGATVCSPLPATPNCAECPVRCDCRGRITGFARLSVNGKDEGKKQVVHHHVVVAMRTHKGQPQVLMQQRGSEGMWAGMWEAVTVENAKEISHTEVMREVRKRTGLKAMKTQNERGFTHHTTHREIEFHVVRTDVKADTRLKAGRWVEMKAALELPMGNAQRKAIQLAVGN